ncbi:hypothetical protein PC128_g9482 [Phytophthora cactorum]|nr:hypothetical protein PC128_g9482 [Phytophthora cactorum]KAG4051914.1 hypothetical protein PC123_g12890 [Phytophthora cactorum]
MAKSVFEPILNHLKRLSSADFYKALEKWEGVVDQSVKPTGTATNTSDKDTCIEEENYDVDLTGYYDTVRMMEEMEAMQDSGDEEEEEGCSPTQPAATTSSQTLLNPITSSVPATLSASATLTSNGSAHTMHEHINEAAVTAADMSLSVFAPSTYSEFNDATLSHVLLEISTFLNPRSATARNRMHRNLNEKTNQHHVKRSTSGLSPCSNLPPAKTREE